MKVAVTVYQTVQTAHDTGKYVADETRVFDLGSQLGEILLWARRAVPHAAWHDLVFTPVEDPPASLGHTS